MLHARSFLHSTATMNAATGSSDAALPNALELRDPLMQRLLGTASSVSRVVLFLDYSLNLSKPEYRGRYYRQK